MIVLIRAFGGVDQDCISLAGEKFKRDYGDELTLQAVNELCIFNLAETMLNFINKGNDHLINRVLDSQYFCAEVVKVFYTLSRIPIEEIAAAEKLRADFEAGRLKPFISGGKKGVRTAHKMYVKDLFKNDLSEDRGKLFKRLKTVIEKDESGNCPFYLDGNRNIFIASSDKEYKLALFRQHMTQNKKTK
ncbi:MAG: hypothetical protein Q8Q81_07135 [Oxalobacteraceae bacterium]|nr:hypothetical protein [Oxalobacteraceae bacterium]